MDHEFLMNNNLTIRDIQEQKLMVNSWSIHGNSC